MVRLEKHGDSAVRFIFTDSDHYLYKDGVVDVPVNSLSLVIDESEMVTFKKASTADPFISFRLDKSNFSSRDELLTFYKENMVGAGGISEEEVQQMIDEATSGIPSSQVIEQLRTDVNTVSGDVADIRDTIDEKEEVIASALTQLSQDVAEIDAKEEVIASALTEVRQDVNTLSGDVQTKADTSAVTAVANDVETLSATVETKQDALEFYSEEEIEDPTDRIAKIETMDDDGLNGSMVSAEYFEDADDKSPFAALSVWMDDGEGTTKNIDILADNNGILLNANEITDSGETINETGIEITPTSATLNGDAIATEPYVDAALSGKADTSAVTAISDSLSGYVQTSAVTTSVTSGSTDSEIPTAKATYDAIQAGGGGGTTYSAGTNISIDTGNTINCTLPIFVKGSQNTSLSFGSDTNTINNYTPYAAAFGSGNNVASYQGFASGWGNKTLNTNEATFGKYSKPNYSTSSFGNAGNTLFTIGNGSSDNARHNAFEIRQNGDIYITSGGTDIKLQDHLGGTSVTVDPTLDTGSTNPVANSAITTAIDAKADKTGCLGTLAISNQSPSTQFKSSLVTYNANGSGGSTKGYFGGINGKAIAVQYTNQATDFQLVEKSAITSAMTSSSTDAQVPSAKAVYDTLGGLKLVSLSQSEYDSLVSGGTVDSSTIYFISNVVS